VFENRVLRRIFGPKRDEVMGDWRKLNSKKLHNLYFSPNITRMIGWDGMDWIDLAQDRDQWRTCEHGDEPSGSLKCWEVPE
jgi:hypothetical protein